MNIVGTRTGAGDQVLQVGAARAPSSRAGRGRPRTPGAGGCSWSTLHSARGRCRAAVAAEDRGMPERRWRVTTGGGRGLFQIDIDDGRGFRPATTAEVDAALRQRELFGAADHPAMEVAGTLAQASVLATNRPVSMDAKRNRCPGMFDQFHDPEFRTLVRAARAVITERVHRGVAMPPERLAVAALNEMPDEDDPAAVRAWGAGCSRRWSSTSASLRRSPTKSTERTATTARRCTDHGRRLPARGWGLSLPLPPPPPRPKPSRRGATTACTP